MWEHVLIPQQSKLAYIALAYYVMIGLWDSQPSSQEKVTC